MLLVSKISLGQNSNPAIIDISVELLTTYKINVLNTYKILIIPSIEFNMNSSQIWLKHNPIWREWKKA